MTAPVKVPPRPSHAPDVHLKPPRTRKPPRTLKGDLKALKGKAASAHTKWAEGRKSAEGKKKEVRKKAGKVLAPAKQKVRDEKKIAGEVTKPVLKAVETVKTVLDPANGKTRPYVTSFMISSVISWAIGPQILVTIYERIRFGTSTTGWGLLQGPGRWFRDTVGMAYETGRMTGLIAAIFMGITPMILMSGRNAAAGYLAQSTYQGRAASFVLKWVARLPYLVPAVYLTGVAYPQYVTAWFGHPWTIEWWQFWIAGLFCTAYYCTMWVFDRIERLRVERLAMSEEERVQSQSMGPGLFHALLMVPLASIVTGVLLYAPGAAW